MKTNDILWDQYGCIIHVNGKTGFRPVRVIKYSGYLELYLKRRRSDSDWVWVNEKYWKGRRMSYKSLRMLLRRIGKKAGITKPVNPQNFRLSSVNYYQGFLTEPEMKVRYGWSKYSRMPGYYSYLKGLNVDNKIISLFYPKKIEVKPNHSLKEFL